MVKSAENIFRTYLIPLHEEALKAGGDIKTRVGGISMYPFLKKGDIITIHPVPIVEIEPGDVIIFKTHDKLVAHRCIKTYPDKSTCLTRGDTCPSLDPIVTIESYLGKIIEVSRKGKYISPNLARKFYSTIMVRGYWFIMMMMRCLFTLNKTRRYLLKKDNK